MGSLSRLISLGRVRLMRYFSMSSDTSSIFEYYDRFFLRQIRLEYFMISAGRVEIPSEQDPVSLTSSLDMRRRISTKTLLRASFSISSSIRLSRSEPVEILSWSRNIDFFLILSFLNESSSRQIFVSESYPPTHGTRRRSRFP